MANIRSLLLLAATLAIFAGWLSAAAAVSLGVVVANAGPNPGVAVLATVGGLILAMGLASARRS